MQKIRLAASGDLHVQEKSEDLLKPSFMNLNKEADIFAIAGDLTASGKLSEIGVLLHELRPIKIPIVAVLGNHEYHHRKELKIKQILYEEGIHVLDGNCVQFDVNGTSIGFAGAKGFLSGFDKRAIPDFGEESLRVLVDELFHEQRKMIDGLKGLNSDIKILIMHYSPTRDTVEGEHREIYAFLGSDALAKPADKYNVDLILHGHCHYGIEKGFTSKKTPVRNVCMPVIKKPYIVYELPF